MSVIKCKMCGGDLELIEGSSVAVCEYCGSQQTVPAADNEKKLTLFARANRLRLACEFDKAAGVYESIVRTSPQRPRPTGVLCCAATASSMWMTPPQERRSPPATAPALTA